MHTLQIYIECVPIYVTSSCSFTTLSVICPRESFMSTFYVLCAHLFYSVNSLLIYVFECAFQCSIMNIKLDRQLFHILMTIGASCAQNVDRAFTGKSDDHNLCTMCTFISFCRRPVDICV